MKYNGTTTTTTMTTTTTTANPTRLKASQANFLPRNHVTSPIDAARHLSSTKSTYSEREAFYLHASPIGATPADLGRVMNNACDKFASHACKRAPVIPLAVPFYRPIPCIQLSNSFHAAKYYSVIPYDHPCATTSQRVWDIVCT